MREKFIEQLQTLYRQMTVMGGLCQQAIAVAVKTLEEEEETAEKLEAQVFALDGEVDDMEREIETLCTKLLLKQQPVAADLRRITAALKMVTDLERIGDQASDIAELARFIRKGGRHEHLHEMAREVIRMVSDAVEAFVHLDLEQARAVIAYDDVVHQGRAAGHLHGGQVSRAHRRPRHEPGRVGRVRPDRCPVQERPLGQPGSAGDRLDLTKI